jgi:hypothetical protein
MKVINNKGQALVEYVLIIVLVAGIAVYLTTVFGGRLRDKITEASCSLVGENYVAGSKSGEGYCE